MSEKQTICTECEAGEHDNYTDKLYSVIVQDPATKEVIHRTRMCEDHVEMYLQDGYLVYDGLTKELI
jgi:hypothetical protein